MNFEEAENEFTRELGECIAEAEELNLALRSQYETLGKNYAAKLKHVRMIKQMDSGHHPNPQSSLGDSDIDEANSEDTDDARDFVYTTPSLRLREFYVDKIRKYTEEDFRTDHNIRFLQATLVKTEARRDHLYVNYKIFLDNNKGCVSSNPIILE